MRVNCHVHVFNLRQVVTPRTREVVRKRLLADLEDSIPSASLRETLADAVVDAADGLSDFNEEDLLRRFLDRLTGQEDVREFLDGLRVDELPDEVRPLLAGRLDGLALRGLRRAVDWLFGRLRRERFPDHRKSDLFDLLETLRLAASPDARRVTERLLSQMGPDDAVVPLMMDITAGAPEDTPHFRAQLLETAELTLAHPGRVLPFVAVNPQRTDPLEVGDRTVSGFLGVMEHALEHLGYVGVKLYPSLGYRVDTPEMRPVYQYCAERGVPLLVHCNDGGFYVSEEARRFPHPRHWEAILEDLPELKVCFAHFGGGGQLTGEAVAPGSWAGRILDLMERFEGVYADVAFHRNPMDSDGEAERYRRNLSTLLAHERFGERILFGTDFWLIRPRLTEANHWRFFRGLLTEAEFRRIAEENPRRFLGLPLRDGEALFGNRALEAHVARLVAGSSRLGARPAGWVLGAVTPAERERLEHDTRDLRPAPGLRIPDWDRIVGELAGRRVTQGFARELGADVSHSVAPFRGAALALEAGTAFGARTFTDAEGHDEEGVLLPREDQPDLAFQPPLHFEPGRAWIRYRVEGELAVGLDAELGSVGLALDAGKTLAFADYRHHEPSEELLAAVRSDLAAPRFALSRAHVLSLGENEAVSFRTRGTLSGQVSLSLRDVFTYGLGTLRDLLGASGPLAVAVDVSASVSARVEVEDDFQVVFARRGGRFVVALRKLDSRGATVTAAVRGAVQVNDPAALAGVAATLVEEAGRSTVEAVEEAVLELAAQRIEGGFGYEYARTEANATLLEATLDERALEELHHALVQGDLDELLDRARRDDPEIRLKEYLRQEQVVRRRAWGFSLGGVSGQDVRQARSVVQKGADGRARLAFRGLRGYTSDWVFGPPRRWQADFRAEMPELLSAPDLRPGALRFGLGLLFEWRPERLRKKVLRECLDAAALWGVLPEGTEGVDGAFARFEEHGLLGKAVELDLELAFDHDALERMLPDGWAPGHDEAAAALALAMPYSGDAVRSDAGLRRRFYEPSFRALFAAAESPAFDFTGTVDGLAHRTRRRMLEEGFGAGAREWDRKKRYRGFLWTFGGMVSKTPLLDPWQTFSRGLGRLGTTLRDETATSIDALDASLLRTFGDLQAFWRQTHHVRGAGVLLLRRARAVGLRPRPTLTATWRDGAQARTRTLTLG